MEKSKLTILGGNKEFIDEHDDEQQQLKKSKNQKQQSNQNKIQTPKLSTILCRPKDVLAQIKFLALASGILGCFSTYLAVGTFDLEGYLRADYMRSYLQNQDGNYQSWQLLVTGLSCSFFQALNVFILIILYLIMTNSGCSQDLSYFQKWYNYFKWVLLSNYLMFALGLYLIFGTIIAAIQIQYPYYCDYDVPGRVQISEEQIRQDVYPCNHDTYGGQGVFKRVGLQFAIAVYVMIPVITVILIGFSILFHVKWQKNTQYAYKMPSKGLKMWLDSMHLERNYEQLFADHGVTLRWLKKMGHREKVIYQALKDIGIQQVGDILKIIASIKSIKNNNDLDSDEGVDLTGQDRSLAYQMKKLKERQEKIDAEKQAKKQQKNNNNSKQDQDTDHIQINGITTQNNQQTVQVPVSKNDDEEELQDFGEPEVQFQAQKNERLARLQQLVSQNEEIAKKQSTKQ
ncbi:Sterile alpha motif/pointed domain [Pseudocohnilembus persalinus]|uniref:Sterile alpha motif/pointed domain n=1 Tax=Pseudocohnilembus persalinus TaxID=266149 RepID=A0A0V0QHC5_PSEPJ|nr:Sterile alpha motif/pointed domain [Pseudocohnilembus persalinus]|eukprot:KRX01461.1 Sterile alpha motif/pointed domain [Pseudocohnilembus persalinus]